MSLLKSTATIGFYTLLSRVLGFARDVTIASGLGASMLSDAFFVAFKLPNFLRRLFAEGAFNSAFVPLFAGMLTAEGEQEAKRFASEAMSFLLLLLIIVSGLFIVAMPWLMVAFAPGFDSDPAKFDLTVTLTRITMPYIVFISLVSLLGGVLNSSDKFAAVAATPVIMNLCLIVLPFFIDRLTPTAAHGLAIAVLCSGVAQWLWLVYFCHKAGMLPRLARPRLTPDLKRLLKLIAPAALGSGVVQINLYIDLTISSYVSSGVSFLYYADRINELPLAVIGIAVGTALLPMLSRLIREGNIAEAQGMQSKAVELSLLFSLPAAAALMVIAAPIIHVMFERGRFTAADTIQTWHALAAFAIGLPAFILVKVLAPGFYANHDTKTPTRIAIICVLVNFTLNLALIVPLRHVGMALATSIAGWLNVTLMTRGLKARGLFAFEARLWSRILRILLACAAMALALALMETLLAPWLGQGEIVRALALCALVGSGMLVFFASGAALGVIDRQALAVLRRRKNSL